MRILQLHNEYQHRGGEYSVLQNEFNLLKKEGNSVEQLLFSNKKINSLKEKLITGLNVLYNFKSAKLLRDSILRFRPDVIHVHNFFSVASPAIFYVARKFNIPIVMTLHNYRLICPNALLLREDKTCDLCIKKSFPINGIIYACYRDSRLQSFILSLMNYIHNKFGTWRNKINRYVLLTDFAKNLIKSSALDIDIKKLVVKPNFVNDYGFELDKEDYFVFIGRLSKEKGISILLNSFIRNKRLLQIIGEGPEKDMVIDIANKHTNIIYCGFRNKEYIIDKLKKARALIFTSIWYEGMPMTILESLSVGTPVIAPNIGAPDSIINHQKNGLIYRVSDLEDLNEKIEMLRNDNNMQKELSKGARYSYELNYNAETNYKMLMNIYNDAIDEKK